MYSIEIGKHGKLKFYEWFLCGLVPREVLDIKEQKKIIVLLKQSIEKSELLAPYGASIPNYDLLMYSSIFALVTTPAVLTA